MQEGHPHEAEPGQRLAEHQVGPGQVGHADLHGKNVLGRHAWDRRGPYVLNPQRSLAERVTQRAGQLRGNPRPVAGVRSREQRPGAYRLLRQA
jgi:hypothetical protein